MSEKKIKTVKKPVSFAKPSAGKGQKTHVTQMPAGAKKLSSQTRIEDLESEIKLLTSYSSDTIYRLDYRNMKYDYISPAVSRLLGFTPQEMKRINFRSLIVETRMVTDGLHKVSSFEELEEKRKGGDVGKWDADYLIRTKSGEKIWVSDISFPWFNDNGKVIGSVGSLRDVTQRVLIEQKLFSDIASLSTQDALTQLPGKTNFFSAFGKELVRIKRSKQSVALIVFEIDDINGINTDYGSSVGDQVIIEISKIISQALRETDFISRVDGGTFAVMLPDTEVKGAYFVADRVREQVIRTKFSFAGDKKSVDVGISAGISVADFSDNISAADMYKLADTRLYIARNTGRNQVSIDELVAVH